MNVFLTKKAGDKEVLAGYGITAETQNCVAEELALDKSKWADFMMKFELVGRTETEAWPAECHHCRILCCWGMIPLSAYFFTAHPSED